MQIEYKNARRLRVFWTSLDPPLITFNTLPSKESMLAHKPPGMSSTGVATSGTSGQDPHRIRRHLAFDFVRGSMWHRDPGRL